MKFQSIYLFFLKKLKKIVTVLRQLPLFVCFLLFLVIGILIIGGQRFYLKRNSETILKEVQKIHETCAKKIIWSKCYTEEFGKLIQTDSFDKTVKVLKKLQTIDARTKSCHGIAHAIATGELKKGNDRHNLVDIYGCSNAYFHSLMEDLLLKKQISTEGNALSDFCHKENGTALGQFDSMANCFHAIGHFAMIENAGKIDESIQFCQKFKNSEESFFCFTGIFMEEFDRDALSAHGIKSKLKYDWETVTQEEQICKKQSSAIAVTCWRAISTLYMPLVNYDPPRIFEVCGRANDQNLQNECYIYATYILVINSYYSGDLSPLCKPLYDKPDDYKKCIAHILLGLDSENSNAKKATVLCETIPEEYQNYCNFMRHKRFPSENKFNIFK